MKFNGQYLTFKEYEGLGGTLSVSAFNLLEYRSRMKIDEESQGRLKVLTEQKQEVKLCVYDLISKLKKYAESTISKESVDGYSIDYNVKTIEEQEYELSDIVFNYLINSRLDDGTPYLYRGAC